MIRRNACKINVINVAIQLNTDNKCNNIAEFVKEYHRLKEIEDSYCKLISAVECL